jgi:molecular chaperone GrpE
MRNSVKSDSETDGYDVTQNHETSADQAINRLDQDDANVDWKETIEANVKIWIEELSSHQDIGPKGEDEPDLYSFYEELCALKTEYRKSARRSHETFSKFGEALSEFEKLIGGLSAKVAQVENVKEKADLLSKKRLFLPLVEILERFKRMESRLDTPPKPGFFTAGRKWNEAWSSLRDGFSILHSHFEELLKKEGITTIDAMGKPFDPSVMLAVEAVETSGVAANTVLEEFSRGYLYRGHILRLAQVKVAKGEGP